MQKVFLRLWLVYEAAINTESILEAVHSQVTREAQECLRKRPSLDTTQSAMSHQQSQRLGETSSPSVSVRKLI